MRLSAQLTTTADPSVVSARFAALLALPTHACFVAIDDDATDAPAHGVAIVEHRVTLQSGARAELTALVVDAGMRRRGTGAALVAASEAWAWRRGLPAMVVRSSLSRDASHAFYVGVGYDLHKTQHVYLRKLTP